MWFQGSANCMALHFNILWVLRPLPETLKDLKLQLYSQRWEYFLSKLHMYQVDLVEATGGGGNFYPDIQPDDKKLLEGMSLEGTKMGFFPAPELLSHRIINYKHRKKLRGYSISSASLPEKISLQYFISTVISSNELPGITIIKQPISQSRNIFWSSDTCKVL